MRRTAALLTLAVALCAGSGVAAAATTAPSATTGSASAQTNTTATVSGTVNPNGTQTTYVFQYGVTTQYGRQTVAQPAGNGTTAASVSQSLTGLTPGTTYHYRLVATNSGGQTAAGQDATFTTTGTPPTPVTPPTVKTSPATNANAHGATVNGTVNPHGSGVTVYFEFGLTRFYGVQTNPIAVPSGNKTNNAKATLNGLQANQTYHYRIVAKDRNGNTVVGADATFRTGASQGGPQLRNLGIRPVSLRRNGTATISYNDSAAATTTIFVERIQQGVRKGGRCVAVRRGSNAKGKRCTLFVRVRTLRHKDKAGVNRVRLSGRGLATGRYRLTAQARNAKGTSPRKRARFRVV